MSERSSPLRTKWQFSAKILLPVAVITLLSIIFMAVALYWVAREGNEISVGRQVQMARHAINGSIDELSKEQQTIAIWDQAVVEFQGPSTNWQWVNDEIGVWLNQLFGHDQVYILNARDEPVYAMLDGAQAPTDSFYEVQADLQPIISGVRSPLHTRKSAGGYISARPQDERVEADAHFLEVNGRPVAASAMKFKPSTDAVVQAPGTEFLLVSMRYLDGSFLQDLATRNLFEEPRFSRLNTASASERSVAFADEDGEVLGYFIWRPELPGTRILQVLVPVAVLVIGTIVIMMLLLVRWLRRSMLELQASEAHAQHLASHDVLTGLPNRSLFEDRLEQALARARRGEKLAVLALDLDRFKHVNDTLGHQAGDALIQDFAKRLTGLVRSNDTVARLGGDEFAIVQVGIQDKSDADALCKRILASVHQPFDLLGSQAFIGTSIGVALAPDMGLDRSELVRRADIALYHAKSQGRDGYRYFETPMDETIKIRSMIEEELRTALATGSGLMVHYQPQLSGTGEAIIGLEALLRWQHPTLGVIPPSQFIPVAEEAGLISRLGEWVLRETCAASLRWPDLFMAVNLSPVQFRSSGFADRVLEIVKECKADPQKIELEITEGLLLENDSQVHETLRALRAAGFRIALDDFGTGYSSLSYLQEFEVDKIKIDRSFVQNIGSAADPEAIAIIEAIVALGHAMGLTVAVEGVETADQKRLLSTAGCNEMQGYLFAPALPQEEIASLLSGSAPAGSRIGHVG